MCHKRSIGTRIDIQGTFGFFNLQEEAILAKQGKRRASFVWLFCLVERLAWSCTPPSTPAASVILGPGVLLATHAVEFFFK